MQKTNSVSFASPKTKRPVNKKSRRWTKMTPLPRMRRKQEELKNPPVVNKKMPIREQQKRLRENRMPLINRMENQSLKKLIWRRSLGFQRRTLNMVIQLEGRARSQALSLMLFHLTRVLKNHQMPAMLLVVVRLTTHKSF